MKTNTLSKKLHLAVLLCGICVTGFDARANNYVWTNISGGNWSVAANWSPNFVPGSGDAAFITTSGTYSVALSAGTSVNSLTVGATNGTGTQSFAMNGFNFTVGSFLTVNNSGAFNLNGGTLNVNGTIQGLVNWTGGQLGSGSLPLTLATNAIVVLAGTNGTDYLMGQFMTNAGTIRVQSGNLSINYCTYYGGLINLPGALIDLQGDVSIDGCGGTGLNNQGTIQKSGGTGVSQIAQIFHNSATVTVQTGTLLLNAATSDANGIYNGAGTVLITNTTFAETGTLSVSNLVLAGGSFSANGTVQESVTWTGGQFGGGSQPMTLASNSTLVLAGTNGTDYIMGEFLTNAGTIRVQSGNFSINYCVYYGGLVNLPGALIDLQGDVSIDGCGGTGLNNQGTIQKSGGTGVSQIAQTFQNSGTVNIQTGTILLNAATSDANGSYIGAGTTLITNITFTEIGSLTVSNLVLAGGTFLGNGTVHGSVTWTGGTFGHGNNSLSLATNTTLVLSGLPGSNYIMSQIVTNAGVIRVLSGNLDIVYCGAGNFGQLINLSGGLVDLAGDVSISGDSCSPGLSNAGTVRKSSGSGISAIDTAFQNQSNGTLNVQTGTILLNSPTSDNGGSYTGAGTTLITNATITVNATLTSANIVLAGGTLSGNGTVQGLITWTSGYFGLGNNRLTIGSNGIVVLSGVAGSNYFMAQMVTNAGIIRVSSGNLDINQCGGGAYGELINLAGGLVDLAGDVSISGDSCTPGLFNFGTVRKSSGSGTSSINTIFQNQPTGKLDIETGTLALTAGFNVANGTLQFVINSANNYSRLTLPGAAGFSGTLGATFGSGYTPTNGTTFNLVSYPSFSGNFTALQLPPSVFWQQIYGATNYSLRVVAGPQFGASSQSGSNVVFSGIDGIAGSNYVILTSTNVALPLTNWAVLSTNTFGPIGQFFFTNAINPAIPQQYFVIRAR